MTSQTAPQLSGVESSIVKYLAPSEHIVTEVRRHWAEMAGPGSAVFAGGVVALLLDTVALLAPPVRAILWLAWLALLGYLLWRIVEWYFDLFVITNKRFILIQGVFTRRVGMMPLGRVTDMRYQRSFIGRIVGYGTFVLESAGQDQALSRIDYLPDSDHLYLIVNDLLFPSD